MRIEVSTRVRTKDKFLYGVNGKKLELLNTAFCKVLLRRKKRKRELAVPPGKLLPSQGQMAGSSTQSMHLALEEKRRLAALYEMCVVYSSIIGATSLHKKAQTSYVGSNSECFGNFMAESTKYTLGARMRGDISFCSHTVTSRTSTRYLVVLLE